MYEFFYQKKSALSRKLICSFVALTFSIGLVLGPASSVSAQYVSNLPQPGTMVLLSPAFAPPVLKGMTLHPENPLQFDFIVDRGQDKLSGDALKNETQKLLKYFLAAMTIPDDDSWVNLSPYEGDRIIPDMLGSTDMGKQMLEQDYLLKQLSASLTNPQEEIGKKFWDTVYKKAYEKFGTTAVPINTFNKVWIVPDRALILEEDGYVFIGETHLKVMLDEDYTSIKANLKSEKFGTKDIAQDKVEALNNVSSEVVRQVILPELEKEINEGKNFTAVRQIYHSVILAAWYKQNLKNSLLGRVYVDKSKIAGVDIGEKDLKQKVYEQYLAAFRKGVYNLIKEDYDLSTKETLPRKYFSGGFDWKATKTVLTVPKTVSEKTIIARSIEDAIEGNKFASASMIATEQPKEAATVEQLAAVASSTVKKPVLGPDAIQISEMIRGIQQRVKDDPRDFLSFVFNAPERLYSLLLELSDIESDQLIYGTRILKKDITGRSDEWFDLADFSNEQLGVLGQILKDRKSGEAESPSSDYLHRIYRESLTRRSPAKQNSKSPLGGLKGARLNKNKIKALVEEVAKIKKLPSVSEEYLKVLLLRLRDYLSGSVPIDVLGRNFIATAFMTEDEVERELSVTKHRDIVQWAGDNPERVAEILKGATVSYQLLNAGFGDNYRRALWNQQLLREGLIAEIKAGAKSQHLGQKVKLSGYDEQGNQADYEIFVSNVQIHYQRLLMKAMAGEYGQGISITEMVNEQSDPTITAMLDEVYIYDKVDHRPNVRKRTWREVFAQTEGISHEDNKMMRSFPGFNPVSAEFNIDTGYNGGHAQVPFSRFIELLTEKLPKGKTKIGIMINADGVNNDVPPETIAHMIEKNYLISVSVTVRGPTHIKGGILGVRLQPIGQEQSDTAMVPAGMELAGAKALGEVAVALFQASGITEGRKGGQLFNTNNIAWNETALKPFLQDLYKIIGEEEYLKVIAPDIIPSAKSYKGEDLLQMEGAALPAILRLNAYLMTTTDSKVKKLLKKHNIDRLVHFDFYSADEVTEFFTEEKTPIHGVLYRSNIYVFNLDTWRFEMSQERKDRFNPLIELGPYYHQDLQVAVDALGKLDLIEAKALRIDGNVLMPNARIVGNVTVNSSLPGDFDLVKWNQKTQSFPINEEGRIVLDNVEITIDREGKVSFQKIVLDDHIQGNVIPSNVDIYEYLATQRFVNVTDIARRLNLVLGTAEDFLAGNGWVETEESGIYTRPGSVGAAVAGMLNGSASSQVAPIADEKTIVYFIGDRVTNALLNKQSNNGSIVYVLEKLDSEVISGIKAGQQTAGYVVFQDPRSNLTLMEELLDKGVKVISFAAEGNQDPRVVRLKKDKSLEVVSSKNSESGESPVEKLAKAISELIVKNVQAPTSSNVQNLVENGETTLRINALDLKVGEEPSINVTLGDGRKVILSFELQRADTTGKQIIQVGVRGTGWQNNDTEKVEGFGNFSFNRIGGQEKFSSEGSPEGTTQDMFKFRVKIDPNTNNFIIAPADGITRGMVKIPTPSLSGTVTYAASSTIADSLNKEIGQLALTAAADQRVVEKALTASADINQFQYSAQLYKNSSGAEFTVLRVFSEDRQLIDFAILDGNVQDLSFLAEGGFTMVFRISGGKLIKVVKNNVGIVGKEQYRINTQEREKLAQLTKEYTNRIRGVVAQNLTIPDFDAQRGNIGTTEVLGESYFKMISERSDFATTQWSDQVEESMLAAINAANRELDLTFDGSGTRADGWQVQVDSNFGNFLFDAKSGELVAWIDPIVIIPPTQNIIESVAAAPAVASAGVTDRNVGGIDFDPSLLNLQIKRNGKGVPLPLPQQNLENINIDGLYPVIINMQPATIQNFPFLISADKQDKVPELSMR